MDIQTFLQQFVNALSLGSLYALIAIGSVSYTHLDVYKRQILEIARERTAAGKPLRVFWPSSIAAFGPNTPAVDTPQLAVMDPTTIYGISKQAGERLCEYYFSKYLSLIHISCKVQ